jgi:hypothetical protein
MFWDSTVSINTNQYKFPLLQVITVTKIQQVILVAFAIMLYEDEDGDTWIYE